MRIAQKHEYSRESAHTSVIPSLSAVIGITVAVKSVVPLT
jgi:hypothetical protein